MCLGDLSCFVWNTIDSTSNLEPHPIIIVAVLYGKSFFDVSPDLI